MGQIQKYSLGSNPTVATVVRPIHTNRPMSTILRGKTIFFGGQSWTQPMSPHPHRSRPTVSHEGRSNVGIWIESFSFSLPNGHAVRQAFETANALYVYQHTEPVPVTSKKPGRKKRNVRGFDAATNVLLNWNERHGLNDACCSTQCVNTRIDENARTTVTFLVA